MVTNLRVQTFSTLSLLVLAFLFGDCYHMTEGFQVSLRMYFNSTPEGDFLHFETKQPNLNDYSEILSKVRLVCSVGCWATFSDINYQGILTPNGSPSYNQTTCRGTPNGVDAKSARFLGGSEATRDSLSLYEYDTYRGNEILVERAAYAGITTPVRSLAMTGTSPWKLFEGQYLEGKSYCLENPRPELNYYLMYGSLPRTWNITAVGSAFRGCNITEIKEYKRNNNIM